MPPRCVSLFVLVLLALVLVGCDAAGGDTATFNAGSTVPPTVEYQFEYDAGNQVDGQNLVRDTSEAADNLNDVLRRNGFPRSTVVSARVDSVVFLQVSPKRAPSAKFVFDNLLRADVYLGTGTDGVHIASGTFDPDDDSDRVRLGLVTTDVTSTVQAGATKAFLQLETTGDITRTDRVRVRVFYEITVEGV